MVHETRTVQGRESTRARPFRSNGGDAAAAVSAIRDSCDLTILSTIREESLVAGVNVRAIITRSGDETGQYTH